MTPDWLDLFKRAERERNKPLMVRLASARCFDLRPVAQLAADVAHDIEDMFARDATKNNYEHLLVDCGVDVAFPSDSMWIEGLECADEKAWFPWPLLCELNPATGRRVLGYFERWPKVTFHTIAEVEIDPGGLVLATLHGMETGNSHCYAARIVPALFGVLAVISSPHAAREDCRRTFAVRQKMRKLGLRAIEGEITHTRVFIRVGGKNASTENLARTSSPKAYHFCRAHLRRRGERTERVRAHWRGDPAFGIRLPSYEVTP